MTKPKRPALPPGNFKRGERRKGPPASVADLLRIHPELAGNDAFALMCDAMNVLESAGVPRTPGDDLAGLVERARDVPAASAALHVVESLYRRIREAGEAAEAAKRRTSIAGEASAKKSATEYVTESTGLPPKQHKRVQMLKRLRDQGKTDAQARAAIVRQENRDRVDGKKTTAKAVAESLKAAGYPLRTPEQRGRKLDG